MFRSNSCYSLPRAIEIVSQSNLPYREEGESPIPLYLLHLPGGKRPGRGEGDFERFNSIRVIGFNG
jgi:hypothetical protein